MPITLKMLLMRLGPRHKMAPKNKTLIFFQVGRENSDENAAKTATISGVNADYSLLVSGRNSAE